MRIILKMLVVTTALFDFMRRVFGLSWLTGPIFDKELRVSSRRRRNYVLRFAYLGFLTTFLVLVWVQAVGYGGAAVYQVSRMAEAGKAIVAYVVWFQFCATQVIAVIMLSTAVSDEIYHQTLGLLMTTPISSFQIVMGKLLSKLLQLILLLAISLPLLAIVRVFGGVPWGYLVSSLCITLTTIIFVGSLSLFLSIFSRRAYVVIIVTVITLGILFALLPLITTMFWHTMEWQRVIPEKDLYYVLFLPNPYCNLFFNTIMMVEPRGAAGMPTLFWPLHCGIILAASGVILLLAMIKVRKVALRQATGQLGVSTSRWRWRRKTAHASAGGLDLNGKTRTIVGPPVIWKELRHPMLGRRKIAVLLAILACLGLLVVTYVLCALENLLADREAHILYAVIFLAIGMLFTIVLPATCITSEKESRSWPLLLATTLNDRDILFGKFAGSVRRCLPAWLLLFGHVIFFSLTGFIHPVAIFQIGILVAWIVVFLSGTGLYFSSCFKHTTTAVITNFALAATIWAILPILMAILSGITNEGDYLLEAYMNTNPFVHACVIMDATAEQGELSGYDWVGTGSLQVGESTFWMLVCMAGYMALGLLFAWRAKCRFRRHIF
ncbi:MAG: ABC transporter permease subunit [Planctomycetota bacterium]